MDSQLLKQLLSNQFYLDNKSSLSAELFHGDYADLFLAAQDAHEAFGQDLTSHDLSALWLQSNPIATRAEKEEMEAVVLSIENAPPLLPEVAASYVGELWKRHVGHSIANLGLELVEGVDGAMERLTNLFEKTRDGLMPNDFGEEVSKDLDFLMEQVSDDNRWAFNLSTLRQHIYGVGPKDFGVIMAMSETGKSAFAISLCCAPGGFCHQGAKVLYLANEEEGGRTMLRCQMACSGMSREDIIMDARRAKNSFAKIYDNIDMHDIQEWDMAKVESYIKHKAPAIVVIDQGDKVEIKGNFNAGHERLRALYRGFREMAKRTNTAILLVSQASVNAKGKTKVSGFDMEGSRIGKMSELDLCIGIGKIDGDEVGDTEPDNTRYITISKNKISGWHGTVICNIEPLTSRYVE